MWGGKKYLSNYNWIASRKIWYCALRHGQRKLCKQYVGQGAAGQELFRGRTQKVCQKRSVLAQKFKVRCGWCQKHRFLAHALKSVWNWSFFHYKREKCHCGTFLLNSRWKYCEKVPLWHFFGKCVNRKSVRSQNNPIFSIVKAKKGWWKWNCLRK